MGEMEDVGRRVGMYMSVIAFGGIAGPPISGAIMTATGGFVDAGYYAGMFFKYEIVGEALILSRWHRYIFYCIAPVGAIPPPRMPMGQVLNHPRASSKIYLALYSRFIAQKEFMRHNLCLV